MSILVLRPGPLTTVQDLGRPGRQHLGVPVNGAMDEVSHRVANMLVGNDEDEATLEFTLQGASLRFEEDAVVALCGADMGGTAGPQAMPWWRPVRIPGGTTLTLGRAELGARAYLAVAGGFDLPRVLGSRASALVGGYGGLEGRALRKGDALPLRDPAVAHQPKWVRLLVRQRRGLAYPSWSASRGGLPHRVRPQVVRVLQGPHWSSFPVQARTDLGRALFQVGPDSDRMGFRLRGAPLARRRGAEVLSEGVVMGAIQVPPSGDPIVLMADRQTAGGYPVIAVVAAADLPLMAQMAPAEDLQLRLVTVAEAHDALATLHAHLARLRQALADRLAYEAGP